MADLPLWLKAVIVGLVEGATEFIPVSSTGHIILAQRWLGWADERANVFAIFIQLPAILAVVWLYRERVWRVIRGLFTGDPAAKRFTLNLLVAFLPAAVLGLLFEDLIDRYLFNPVTVAIALVLGGIAILIIEAQRITPRAETVDDIAPRDALKVGFAQVLSMFPGVSRSGATIMGGLVFGLSRTAAAEFSFFLAIPVMVGASALKLFKERDLLTLADVPLFAIGSVTSFVSALLVIRWLIAFVSHNTFRSFAWYRIVFGVLLLAFFYWGGWSV